MKRATLKDIQQTSTIDTNNMTVEQLRNLVGNAADIANKRIKRLQANEWGRNSIAYQKWADAGAKKFSTKGKNEGQLKAEFKRVKNFLESQTGSVTGQTKFRRKIEERLGRKFETPEEESKFWEGYRAWESKEENKGYLYESNGAVTAYGSTTEADIEAKMSTMKPKYTDENGVEFIWSDFDGYVDEKGNLLTYEQARDIAEGEVIRERADKYLIASPESQALRGYSFEGPGLGGN